MFMVYWSSLVEDKMTPFSQGFDGEKQMTDALAFMEVKRKEGASFVTFVQENPNCVTKPGVDSIKDGMCPDGVPYTWVKRRAP